MLTRFVAGVLLAIIGLEVSRRSAPDSAPATVGIGLTVLGAAVLVVAGLFQFTANF